jgi:hypothetical protein
MKRSFSDQIRRLSNRLFPNLKIVRCKDLPDAVAVAVAVAVAERERERESGINRAIVYQSFNDRFLISN